jgi:ABC-type transport system involved in multi-copper enzyme maturation permease subunit
MKYWAILKDSFKEALDTKVIYVMVGLSLLVTLVVASMSFKPLQADTLMKQLVGGQTTWFRGETRTPAEQRRQAEQEQRMAKEALKQGKGLPSDFEFVRVEAIKGPTDSPDSEYATTVRLRFPEAEGAEKVRKSPADSIARLRQRFTLYEQLDLIKINDVRLAGPGDRFVPKRGSRDSHEVFFEVTTQPTEATRRLWPHEPSLFFGALPLGGSFPLGFQLFLIASSIMQIGAWVAILVSIILTAFFIPNMMRKGTVDLLLVKPIHRWTLLVYKYIGGLTFIFLNTAVAILGIWLALGLRSGIWANGFLLTIFIITFFFAVLYAVSTLFGVLTQSSIVAILMTCGAWFVFFIVGTLYQVFDQQAKVEEELKVPQENRWSDNTFGSVVKTVHFVLPRTSDLSQLMSQLLLSDFLTGQLTKASQLNRGSITWGESLTVSAIFIALMLGLACWRFATKDY